jgi:hypothetical protein
VRRLVTGEKKRVADWIASKIPCGEWVLNYEAIGIERDGELVGGVVIDSYVKDTRCAMHCAGTGKYWLNREFLAAIFGYVFYQMKCRVAVITVSSTNKDSLRFTKHVGFTETCRIPNGCEDGDLVILAMQKSDCRWVAKE